MCAAQNHAALFAANRFMQNDGPPVDLRLHAALEIITVLYDAVDMQSATAGVGNLDGFLRPLVDEFSGARPAASLKPPDRQSLPLTACAPYVFPEQ